MKSHFRFWLFAVLPLAAALAVPTSGQSMKLEWAGQTGDVRTLRVIGADAPAVNLQGSFDLRNWFDLGSTSPSQGVASFEHRPAEVRNAWYYRAVIPQPPAGSLNVGPQPDPLQSVAVIVTPEEGGVLELTDTRGITFRLAVPASSVREPTLMSMTVITNFTNMPLENRFQAAVNFEPDGFEFRKPAELKMRFPEALPQLEMIGYMFDGSGGGFHLYPWDATSQEVTLAVSHFSGAGTTAQSFSGNPNLDFRTVNNTYFDARQNAEQTAAASRRKDSQQLKEGRIDQQQFEENNRLTKDLRVIEILQNGILPGLAAAASDCEIGRVTLLRLDQLEGETGEPYGQGVAFRKIQELAPLVRCNCARKYLKECEENPAADGVELSKRLNSVLDLVQVTTGRFDDQGCDLGDDAVLLERLAKGACHGEWEGTVKYDMVESATGRFDFGNITQDHHLLYRFTYSGRLAALDRREFIDFSLFREDGEDRPDEWWWFYKTEGKISGFYSERNIIVSEHEDYTSTTTETTLGSAAYSKRGDEFNLHFLDDASGFESAGFGVGLGATDYPMSRKTTTVHAISCKVPDTRRCPKPTPTTQSEPFKRDMFGSIGGNRRDKKVKFTYAKGRLNVTVTETLREPLTGNSGTREIQEILTLDLWRGNPR